jgi:long-chain acyl-CoA synthetase
MLVDVLLDANRRCPHTLAVADEIMSLTYRRLTLLSTVMRDIVRRETRCERVGIMLPASAMFPPTLFGVLWSSKIAVPLNFLLSADELSRIVKDAELDLVLTIGHFKGLAAMLPARALFLEKLPLKRKVLLAMCRRLPPPPQVDPHATAVILYTSGTTAEPKGIELTYNNLYSNCVDGIHTLRVASHQTLLNILPPFHVFGLTATVLIPVVNGMTVYAIPRFSPVAVVKTVAAKNISVIAAIPSLYAAILKAKSASRESLSSIGLAISAGEPLPDSVRIGFQERFGITLRQGYGLTETSPVVSVCSLDVHRDGTVGRPIRNVEVRIVDSEGRDLPTGEEGEILVRGPCVMKGYYRKPEETRRAIDAEGWFRTGDLGRFDKDGYLTITGRVKEMLIVGGENVYPREIEAALETHEAVLQAAVIGLPHGSRGEVPVAFVIPKPGAKVTELELRNHARQLLAGFKVPRQIYVTEDLPKSPTGKVLKRRLRELCSKPLSDSAP